MENSKNGANSQSREITLCSRTEPAPTEQTEQAPVMMKQLIAATEQRQNTEAIQTWAGSKYAVNSPRTSLCMFTLNFLYRQIYCQRYLLRIRTIAQWTRRTLATTGRTHEALSEQHRGRRVVIGQKKRNKESTEREWAVTKTSGPHRGGGGSQVFYPLGRLGVRNCSMTRRSVGIPIRSDWQCGKRVQRSWLERLYALTQHADVWWECKIHLIWMMTWSETSWENS